MTQMMVRSGRDGGGSVGPLHQKGVDGLQGRPRGIHIMVRGDDPNQALFYKLLVDRTIRLKSDKFSCDE